MFTYSSKGSEKNVETLYMKQEVGGNQLLEIQKHFQSLWIGSQRSSNDHNVDGGLSAY